MSFYCCVLAARAFFVPPHLGRLRTLWPKPQEGTHPFTGRWLPIVTSLLQTTGMPLPLSSKQLSQDRVQNSTLSPVGIIMASKPVPLSLTSAVSRNPCWVAPIPSSCCLVTLTAGISQVHPCASEVVKFLFEALWTEPLPRWIGLARSSMENESCGPTAHHELELLCFPST